MTGIKTLHGQPSYTVESDLVSAFVTVQGGHLTADFKCGEKEIAPFFVAPWWNEKLDDDSLQIINVLRGDFFCFPFGVNAEPYHGKTYPVHGQTSNDNWNFISSGDSGNEKLIKLALELDNGEGRVQKLIKLNQGEPLIYSKHTISGYAGKMPLGHHPTLQLPDQAGAALLDMTEPVAGFTDVAPLEDPAKGGYSIIKTNMEIKDRKKVQGVDGQTYDLTRHPALKGFEDVVIFISDDSKEFTFSSLAFPEQGYLYFQLKDPKVLAETLLWMSNSGRHYAPWNGRVTSVMGVEEVTSFYYYGAAKSVAANALSEKGFKTFADIDGKEPYDVNIIIGVVPISSDYKGVKDIVKKDPSTIAIIGKGGEEIEVPCQVDFLFS